MPKVSLSSVGLDGETDVLEIENFGQVAQQDGALGMAAAGTEEKIMR